MGAVDPKAMKIIAAELFAVFVFLQALDLAVTERGMAGGYLTEVNPFMQVQMWRFIAKGLAVLGVMGLAYFIYDAWKVRVLALAIGVSLIPFAILLMSWTGLV